MRFARIIGLMLIVVCFVSRAAAQNPDMMLPEQNQAKGKQILKELIAGLGGRAYSEARENACSGRRALFGRNSELAGYVNFNDFRHFPDKTRIEYIGKGRNTIVASLIGLDGLDFAHGGIVIVLYNGDRGWSYDRSGVNDLPAASVADFHEGIKRSVDNLLRFRLHEPGISVRFGGNDVVDLKQVDWVEVIDSENRIFRLAVDHATHLLVRAVVNATDSADQQANEDVSIYSNYQLKDGVWTAMQVSREHNGQRTAQFFFDTCRFDPGLPKGLFEKASLQKNGAGSVLKKK